MRFTNIAALLLLCACTPRTDEAAQIETVSPTVVLAGVYVFDL